MCKFFWYHIIHLVAVYLLLTLVVPYPLQVFAQEKPISTTLPNTMWEHDIRDEIRDLRARIEPSKELGVDISKTEIAKRILLLDDYLSRKDTSWWSESLPLSDKDPGFYRTLQEMKVAGATLQDLLNRAAEDAQARTRPREQVKLRNSTLYQRFMDTAVKLVREGKVSVGDVQDLRPKGSLPGNTVLESGLSKNELTTWRNQLQAAAREAQGMSASLPPQPSGEAIAQAKAALKALLQKLDAVKGTTQFREVWTEFQSRSAAYVKQGVLTPTNVQAITPSNYWVDSGIPKEELTAFRDTLQNAYTAAQRGQQALEKPVAAPAESSIQDPIEKAKTALEVARNALDRANGELLKANELGDVKAIKKAKEGVDEKNKIWRAKEQALETAQEAARKPSPMAPEESAKMVKYQYLVKRVAQWMSKKSPLSMRSQIVEDFISFGQNGLQAAVKDYKLDKGTTFETYAQMRIRGSILDELRRFKGNRMIYDDINKINSIQEKAGEILSLDKLVDRAGISKERIITALEMMKGIESLEAIPGGKESVSAVSREPPPDYRMMIQEEVENLSKKAEKAGISKRDIEIVRLYRLGEGGSTLTEKEIGARFGLSGSRVSLIISKVENAMRGGEARAPKGPSSGGLLARLGKGQAGFVNVDLLNPFALVRAIIERTKGLINAIKGGLKGVASKPSSPAVRSTSSQAGTLRLCSTEGQTPWYRARIVNPSPTFSAALFVGVPLVTGLVKGIERNIIVGDESLLLSMYHGAQEEAVANFANPLGLGILGGSIVITSVFPPAGVPLIAIGLAYGGYQEVAASATAKQQQKQGREIQALFANDPTMYDKVMKRFFTNPKDLAQQRSFDLFEVTLGDNQWTRWAVMNELYSGAEVEITPVKIKAYVNQGLPALFTDTALSRVHDEALRFKRGFMEASREQYRKVQFSIAEQLVALGKKEENFGLKEQVQVIAAGLEYSLDALRRKGPQGGDDPQPLYNALLRYLQEPAQKKLRDMFLTAPSDAPGYNGITTLVRILYAKLEILRQGESREEILKRHETQCSTGSTGSIGEQLQKLEKLETSLPPSLSTNDNDEVCTEPMLQELLSYAKDGVLVNVFENRQRLLERDPSPLHMQQYWGLIACLQNPLLQEAINAASEKKID
jgi:RNA polymerase sigma factor for flagellar operon FliA